MGFSREKHVSIPSYSCLCDLCEEERWSHVCIYVNLYEDYTVCYAKEDALDEDTEQREGSWVIRTKGQEDAALPA